MSSDPTGWLPKQSYFVDGSDIETSSQASREEVYLSEDRHRKEVLNMLGCFTSLEANLAVSELALVTEFEELTIFLV
jgi:hypothetical protein